MLDIKWIKENAEYAKKRLATRQKDYSAEIDRLLALDIERRALIADRPSRTGSPKPFRNSKRKGRTSPPSLPR